MECDWGAADHAEINVLTRPLIGSLEPHLHAARRGQAPANAALVKKKLNKYTSEDQRVYCMLPHQQEKEREK